MRELLAAQRTHWERAYVGAPDKFGWTPSFAAKHAARVFKDAALGVALEIGCGAGRDALFLAECGFRIEAVDYARSGVAACSDRAKALGLAARLWARVHDVRKGLPFADAAFDGVFAHMLHNMALRDDDLLALFDETRRVLRPKGLLVFSVRNTDDPDAVAGTPLLGLLREVDGDVIRFFSHDCIERFLHAFDVLSVAQFEEGTLPKRLFLVTARSRAGGE